MNTQPTVSVVIPTCNRPGLLKQCLDALELAIVAVPADSVEVIVTDDSSDDATRIFVTVNYPWVKWVRGPRRGPASNRNTGARAATGAWLLFTDDDCLPAEGWVREFTLAVAAKPGCHVFEGRTVADRERSRMDEESPVNLDGGYLWSCNMAIGRATFERMGGFCETFPNASMEDVDLRMRLRRAGEDMHFVSRAQVCHPLRRSKGLAFCIKSGRSYLHLAERHPDLLGKYPWRTLLRSIASRAFGFFRELIRYRGRGVDFAFPALAIAMYFETAARTRLTLAPRAVPEKREA